MVPDKYQISKTISEYRYKGKIDEAIKSAKEAALLYDKEDIFWKLLGDLYFQKNQYEKAGRAYIEFLKRVGDHLDYFKNFAKFWLSFKEKADEEIRSKILDELRAAFNRKEFSDGTRQQLAEMFARECEALDVLPEAGSINQISRVKKWIVQKEKEGNYWDVYILMFQVLKNVHDSSTKIVDKYVVSVMERYGAYMQAIQLVSEVLRYDTDEVAVRTLLRLCRKVSDYTKAEEYFENYPETLNKGNFNIQYELVYYYDFIGDERGVTKALNQMKHSAESSIPISRTLYNFYLRFGMIDEAAEQRRHTEKLVEDRKGIPGKSDKGIEQEKESEEAVWMKMKDLISEQEHNRQLAAMSELLKGFSHELGQPITNIRYAVQVHQMKLELKQSNQDEIEALLNSILKQTVRIKRLLNRFSPIVSGKSAKSQFLVSDRIRCILEELESRLEAGNIETQLDVSEKLFLEGDAIQFDQVFYNLIANSIEAMKDQTEGKIWITVKDNNRNEIVIIFTDNGPGISPSISKKIFEPFYSTKDKKKGEGGEGLGLFIVWNILKMYGGKIRVDESYHNGAKFLINIPAGREKANE